jgi:murein DD-endopeptidase MepM/ murein hydrolase activator NlpD
MGSASYTMPNEADASSQRNDTPMYRIRSGSISRDGFPRMELLKEYEKQGEKTHPEIVTAKILLDEVEACVDGVVDDLEDLADTLRNRKDFQQAQPTIKPVNGRITSRFGWRRSPFGRYREFHGGIDIAAPTGTTVRASGDGMVVFSGRKGALGLTVIVDHGYGYLTYYGHNSKNLVKTGERVEKGQAIARVGASGRTTGPHVHYEIHYKGSRVDPLTLMKE